MFESISMISILFRYKQTPILERRGKQCCVTWPYSIEELLIQQGRFINCVDELIMKVMSALNKRVKTA